MTSEEKAWKMWNQNIKIRIWKVPWTVLSSFIKILAKGIGITKSNFDLI